MNTFEKIIKDYIEGVCKTDEVLAKKYADSNQDIAGCCSYIKSQAKKKAQGGCAVIEDAEVFGWAVHYFDEEMTAPKEEVACKVESRMTIKDIDEKFMPKPQPKPVVKPQPKKVDDVQMSLFNFDEE